MPAQERHKTKYPGVYYINGKAIGSNKSERIFYIMYRKDGKQIHEKAGRQFQDDMTPARAATIRATRISDKQPSNKQKRRMKRAEKDAGWLPVGTLICLPGFWERLEKVANGFASCLLLPAEPVTVEFNKYAEGGKISYTDLIGIARDFGVSTEALLYRLLNLKQVSQKSVDKALQDPIFREIDRSTMRECWWYPLEIPERFVRLAFMAYQKGRLSRAKFSEMLDTSLLDLPEVLQDTG